MTTPSAAVPITGRIVDQLRTTGVQGWVPCVDFEPDEHGVVRPVPKLRPWWEEPIWRNRETGALGFHPDYRPGNTFSVEIQVEPEDPVQRTTARQKFEAMKALFRSEAQRFLQPDGEVHWPASVQRDLNEVAWKQGKAGKLDLEEQVELLARHGIEFAANRQKEIDGKRVTTGWHGHSAA